MSTTKYDNRYAYNEPWPLNQPSNMAMETDLNIYCTENIAVPTSNHTNKTCLQVFDQNCLMYRTPLFNLKKTSIDDIQHNNNKTIPVTDTNFTIRPGEYGKLPLRLRRIAIRDKNRVAAIVMTTGSGRSQTSYSHDGLVISPNCNFVGEFCSEIGQVGVYNSNHNKTLEYSTFHSMDRVTTPIGLIFEHLPADKKFEPVSMFFFNPAAPENATIKIQPKSYRCIKMGLFNEQTPHEPASMVKNGGLFYTSIGACEIPCGVFFDHVISENSEINVYNITDTEKTIVLRETVQGMDQEEETVDYFLGYIVQFKDPFKVHTALTNSLVFKIDLNNVPFHMGYLLKCTSSVNLPPYVYTEITLNSISVQADDSAQSDKLPDGSIDRSYTYEKYIKIVSLKEGIIVITTVLNTKLYRKRNHVCISALNVSQNNIILNNSEHYFGLIVSQAVRIKL
uniref:Wsv526-like protein n=1 Tax=Pasiphaea japonica whispovirus TaxID=2984286 RepID=A0A9C7EZB2_9VIRU|nr:MAG: wsv526-like protein [Pasiphaea japonica whispovirus]